MKAYEYHHVVGFEETSFVGNVYYAHYIHWQGRAREMFLRDHAPEILEEMERGFALITLRCSCDYLGELKALDEITLRMILRSTGQNRIVMGFEYWRDQPARELVARGEQEIACMRRQPEGLTPVPIPRPLREALNAFAISN